MKEDFVDYIIRLENENKWLRRELSAAEQCWEEVERIVELKVNQNKEQKRG